MVLPSSVTLFLVRFVEGEEEGVGHAFGGDVGAWTVARDDRDVSVEGDYLFKDALHYSVIIAARVVCAADCSCKEGVSAEEHLFGTLIVAYASDSVARSVYDLETQAADFYDRNRSFRHIPFSIRLMYIAGLEGLGKRCSEISAEIYVVLEGESVCRVHIYRKSSIIR